MTRHIFLLIEDYLTRLDIPFHINNKANAYKNVTDAEATKLYDYLKKEDYFLTQISRLFKNIGDDRYKFKIVLARGVGYYFTLHGLNCSYFDSPIVYDFYRALYLFWLGRESSL